MKLEMVDTPTEEKRESSLSELDAEVAQKIFGYYRVAKRKGPFTDWHEAKCGGAGRCAPYCGFNLPRYSGDIAEAMKVVVRLCADGYSFACTIYQGHLPYASFCRGTVASSKNAEANTLPEAICRAALALVDGNQETK